MFRQDILKKIALGLGILSLVFSFSNTVLADSISSTPSTTVTFASGGGGSIVSWNNPDNSQTSDDSYTISTFSTEDSDNQNTNSLKATNFGFSIPPTAIIDGIIVEVERHASLNDDNTNVKDLSLKLVKSDDSLGVDNKADTSTFWDISDSSVSYGGTGDLWGNAWTPTDINNSNFGVSFIARLRATATTSTANVDSFTITVVYHSLPILTTINVTPVTLDLVIPNTGQLTTETLDQFGAPISATLVWESDNTTIATVDSTGLVTAVTSGTANITATEGAISSLAVVVNVAAPVPESGGSSGGGSRRARALPPTVQPILPPVGQVLGEVLGAEKFVFTLFLKQGSRGDEVKELQKFLNGLGYSCGVVDGLFGPKTDACVRAFQAANPPLVVDGIVGPLTRAVLNR